MDAEGKMKKKNSSIFMELAEKSKKVMIWEKIAKWCFLYVQVVAIRTLLLHLNHEGLLVGINLHF